MSYEKSTFAGDEIYSIPCTGDAVLGDEVSFERATFSGSFRRPKFDGFERVSGKIVADSYGAGKQQHTFTLETETGKVMIKGRNLYANGTWRKPWADESARNLVADEKHARGGAAPAARATRLEERGYDRY